MTTSETMRTFYTAIFDVLVREAGASESMREEYVSAGVRRWEQGLAPSMEWRFQGALGHGGKIRWRYPLRFTVDCYSEDETPERLAMIERANAALAELCARSGL